MTKHHNCDIIKVQRKERRKNNMKSKKEFYIENLETIKDLEDRVYNLTVKMERECGKQDFKEKLNQAWSLLYEVCKENDYE